MLNKKYYLISEVAQILKIPLYKLRYLEKSRSDIKIHKVKNRRYYTQDDIQKLKIYCQFNVDESCFINTKMLKCVKASLDNQLPDEFIIKIEDLIKNFRFIKNQLTY